MTLRPDATETSGGVAVRRIGDRLELVLEGRWVADAAARLDRELRETEVRDSAAVRIELSRVDELDTAGAWLVHRTAATFRARGLSVELVGVRPSHASLLATIAEHDRAGAQAEPESRVAADKLELFGRATVFALVQGRDLIEFLGTVVVTMGRALWQPRRIRVASLATHMERSGLDALPIVGLLSGLIGVVLAYQGATELARFGAEIFTANLVGLGVLREMGILLTAIIVAGRSGSAFAAQIGTMKVNEEIDAMRAIGIDPVEALVLPRILGLMLVLPLLTVFADVLGLLGGALTSSFALDITMMRFAEQVRNELSIRHFWVGVSKAPLFAFIIALCGCFEGLQAGGSAASVGLHTTRAVVESIVLVIAFDALLSVVFASFGI